MFPGVLAMTILFTATFSAVSIVWDREFGFLREMLVAPVRRGAIIVGKASGAPPWPRCRAASCWRSPVWSTSRTRSRCCVVLVVEMALAAFMLTAFGLMLASGIQQVESFQVVVQFFVMPMFFLAGALFPLSGLPDVAVDPDPARPAGLRRRPDAPGGLPRGGRARGGDARPRARASRGSAGGCPRRSRSLIVAVLGVTLTVIAAFRFAKTE